MLSAPELVEELRLFNHSEAADFIEQQILNTMRQFPPTPPNPNVRKQS